MSDVSEYYDEFSERQTSVGINHRHLSIGFHVTKCGLKKHHRVLEVGCGVGTVSEVMLKKLSQQGFLHGIDISPRSIDRAKQLCGKYSNAKFEVRDLTTSRIEDRFDVVVLPDVIEHIPWESYTGLFENIAAVLKDDGFVFIHIPHPVYHATLAEEGSSELQIIDHPVNTNSLLSLVYPAGFYVHYLKSYSIYNTSDDYQIIVLKKHEENQAYEKRSSFFKAPVSYRIFSKLSYLIRGGK